MTRGVLLVLISCAQVRSAGGEVGGAVADALACPTGIVDCGHVYMCEEVAGNPLGHVEVCVDDDADDGDEQLAAVEAHWGACEPTPRHQGLCLFHCDEGPGCNAYSGCWCPP